MTKINVEIAKDVAAEYPHTRLAGVRAVIPAPTMLVPLIEGFRAKTKETENELAAFDPISELPEIACWREAYAKMAVKPSKFHSSIEALLRRVKKGQDITTGLPVVDFYNLISIINKAPIGAYDAEKFSTPYLTLRLAKPESDRFDPLGSSSNAFPLNRELVVYASGPDVLCWGFNSRDSKIVCVDERSQEILFFSESATEDQKDLPEVTIQALARALQSIGIETGDVLVLDGDNPNGNI